MIVYPETWKTLGKPVSISDIDNVLLEIVSNIDCNVLSYSGGVDSSILLHYMLATRNKVSLYTVANSPSHPDIYYSKLGYDYYKQKFGKDITHNILVIENVEGDELVKKYYEKISQYTDSIITGDCVDELMCGYYMHQTDNLEETYHELLNQLQSRHLVPLNTNPGKVKVYIPYADSRFVLLASLIPLHAKVNSNTRKILINNLAEDKVPDDIIGRRKYGLGTSAASETGKH